MSLQKKLSNAEQNGITKGLTFGLNWSFDIFEQVINNAQGIGEKKKQAILQEIQKKAEQFRGEKNV